MVSRELKLILFASVNGEAPLFASQRDLVRAITTHPGSKYSKGKETSVAAFLSQILQEKRPCPPDLETAIIDVTLAVAAARNSLRPQLEEQLRATLRGLRLSKTDLIEVLLARQFRAKEVLLEVPRSLSGAEHPRSNDFQDVMIDSIAGGSVRYVFVLEDGPAIDTLWASIYDAFKSTAAYKDARDEDCRAEIERSIGELEKHNVLKIVQVGRGHCTLPLVAFDPHDREDCEIYHLDWERNAKTKETETYISAVSRRSVDLWRTDFYIPLILRSAKRVPFVTSWKSSWLDSAPRSARGL